MGLTLYRDVQRPLTVQEIDANFEYAAQIAETIRDQGLQAETFGSFNYDADTGLLTIITTVNRAIGPLSLPARQFKPKGAFQVGVAYKLDDIFEALGDQYRATRDFTSSTLDVDLAAGNAQLWLKKGADTYKLIGAWTAGNTYKAKDGVIHGRVIDGKNYSSLYTAVYDVPADAPAPAQYNPYWKLLATSIFQTIDTFDVTEAKFLNVIVADYKARLGKLEAAMTNVMTRLHDLDGKTYAWPWAL